MGIVSTRCMCVCVFVCVCVCVDIFNFRDAVEWAVDVCCNGRGKNCEGGGVHSQMNWTDRLDRLNFSIEKRTNWKDWIAHSFGWFTNQLEESIECTGWLNGPSTFDGMRIHFCESIEWAHALSLSLCLSASPSRAHARSLSVTLPLPPSHLLSPSISRPLVISFSISSRGYAGDCTVTQRRPRSVQYLQPPCAKQSLSVG